MHWILKPYKDLSLDELYAILKLRSAVFVVEQNCVFLDMDDKDQGCHHLMGWEDTKLIAYTRLVPPGIAYDLPSIGRVVTDLASRASGKGRELMQQSIDQCIRLFGEQPIKISAQCYLEKFYASFGFKSTSEPYIEDGIPHLEMIRS